jgi:ABC-type phosphate transport system auxiliary subunit
MNLEINAAMKPGKIGDLRIENFIALIDELIAVVIEENAALAQGLPASRSKQIARKTELAGTFESLVKEINAKKITFQSSDERLRLTLAERLKQLQGAMDENVVRLRAAIAASKRRIDAVMRVIREQVSGASPYTASGRPATKFASTGTSFSA